MATSTPTSSPLAICFGAFVTGSTWARASATIVSMSRAPAISRLGSGTRRPTSCSGGLFDRRKTTSASRRASETWRSPDDLAHRGFLSLEAACDLALAAPETFTRGPRSERERGVEAFHFRATLFGHLGLATDTPPSLAEALEARATLVIAARALAVVAELTDLEEPGFAWPLSLTEALARGFGLSVAG